MKNKKTMGVAILSIGLMVGSLFLTACGIKGGSGVQTTAGNSAQRDYILIGMPYPATGPLAGFGAATPMMEQRAIDAVNKDGGIFIKELNKKLPLKIKAVDTQSDPTKAAQVASQLVLDDKVDILLSMPTPDVVSPVSAVAERYGIPAIGMESPPDSWLTGGPFKWSFDVFCTGKSIGEESIAMINLISGKTNKTVGLLCPNDSDGISFANVYKEKLAAQGYKVVDPGRYPNLTTDYSAIINQFKSQNVDIVAGVPIPPDFATFWKQAHQQGFVPKFLTMGKAFILASDVEALGGTLPQGLSTVVYWTPDSPYKSSLNGETGKQIADAWTQQTGKPWMQALGSNYAGIELVADALKRAQSLDKEKIREAISQTNLNTMIGPVKFNNQNYAEYPLVGGQWQKGTGKNPWELQIIENSAHPEIPKTADIVFPIPK